jgi:hypothetical protein
MDVPPPPSGDVPEGPRVPGEPRPGQGGAAPQRSPAEAFADRLDEGRFFPALFDLTFTRYITRRLAGPLYVVGLAVIALGVVYGFMVSLGVAVATGVSWGVLLFLFGVIVTVVGAMLAILLLRVGIEMVVAIVTIAQQTRAGVPNHPNRRDDGR